MDSKGIKFKRQMKLGGKAGEYRRWIGREKMSRLDPKLYECMNIKYNTY